ncbi:MAG TPA: hypothetical protein VF110_01910 [Burkholderiales bacterium]
MRNLAAILAVLALGLAAAQAQEKTGPLVGPGVAGAEKDEKGGVKGVGDGGPHRHFNPQFERRVDSPDEAIEKEKKTKEEKARQEERAAAKASAGSGR